MEGKRQKTVKSMIVEVTLEKYKTTCLLLEKAWKKVKEL